jgi:uncharacterized protein YggE
MRQSMVRPAILILYAARSSPLAAQPKAVPPAEPPAEPAAQVWRMPPVLSVSGSGEARVAPDEATVRLGTQAQAATARAAQEQVNRTTAAILAAIEKLGVAAARIQTSELSLGPVYSSNPRGEEPRITGYQAGNVVSVLLDRLDRVGPVVDAGLASGANRLEGVSFSLHDDTAARATALAQAVGQARRKAEALAAALHMRLVELAEVVEEGVERVMPSYGMVRAMAPMASASTPVSPGELSISAGVTLRYHIAPCPAQGPCDGGP